ncbi:MAG: polyisoprenyl-teichoic acid--peptidoglycan teichoic acid transferase [Gaiellales bacterium]|nr:polyisoprenyl-teichoic acid--peptidoglycan teichoic acid transferase [Gaiellales bacterium]
MPPDRPSQPASTGSGGDGAPPRKPPRSVYDTRRSKRRRPRWVRIVLWTGASLGAVVLIAALVVGWWVHGLVDKVSHISDPVKASQSQLHDLPTSSQPTIALVIGSDHRSGDGKGAPSRSDTLMLVRIDPRTKYISLLSLPRDLHVEIPGHGMDKINAAYSDGGYKLALQTVENVTQVNVNYLITVDFSGFTQLVGAFGGVYVPVDQYYHHVNVSGSDQYSQIDIAPGYQKLNGLNGLAFSRYRHTDSDFYRNARQQVFLKAFEQRAASQLHGIGLDQLSTFKHVAETIANSVQVTGKNGPPSVSTMITYATTAYSIRGRVISAKLDAQTAGDATNSYVEATPEAMRQAVFAFLHPDSVVTPKDILPGKETGGKKPPEAFKPKVDPASVAMIVLNGNGTDGSAGKAGAALMTWGYPATISTTPAPSFSFTQNAIYYRAKDKLAAQDVAAILGSAQTHPITPAYAAFAASGLVVVIGKDFHGTLAKNPPAKAPAGGLPPDMVRDATTYRDPFLQADGPANFPVLYPTVRQTASVLQTGIGTPVRYYNIRDAGGGNNSAYAYWWYNGTPGAYWGIEETRFVDAPILANPDQQRTLDGRQYRFYFNGAHIHMIAFIWHGTAYWVQNTLRDDMSNEDMIAVARSLKRAR